MIPSRISASVHHSIAPPGLAGHLEREVPVGGRADRERTGDRVGLHRRDLVRAVPERLGHRPAALGLRAAHPVRLLLDRADGDQLLERPVDLRQQGAARDRHDDVIGQAPPELLGRLEPEGLRALRVVRAHVHVHERPRQRLRDLGAQAVHVVVVPLHRDDLRAVGLGREDLRALEVVGDEHVARHPGVRGVRGGGVREVAGGRAGERLEPERPRHRRRHRDDAILERVRGVDRVVLDPEVLQADRGGEPVGAAERREAGAQVHPVEAGPARQEHLVAPQRWRARPRPACGSRCRRSRRGRRRARAGRSTPRRSSAAPRCTARRRSGTAAPRGS